MQTQEKPIEESVDTSASRVEVADFSPEGKRLWALAESAPVAIYHSNAAGNIIYANPAYRQIFGAALEEGSNDWARAVHPADRGRLEAGWEDLVLKPRSWNIEYRALSPTGVTRFLVERVVPAVGTEGFVGTITDVTDLIAAQDARKTAEVALERSRSLLEAVVAEMPVALVACDAMGRATIYNQAAVELLLDGVTKPSLSGVPGTSLRFADMYLPNGVTPVIEAERPLSCALRGQKPTNIELVVVREGSMPRAILASARCLAGPDGECVGAVSMVQDITERQQKARELEQIHKQLMDGSRQAGMAEIATNVLHNVGNVLNSVNVSAALITERITKSKISGLSRVAAMLHGHGDDLAKFMATDERALRLPSYLTQLALQLTTDQSAALTELAVLVQDIDHIKDIVRMQQSYAKVCGVTETVDVAALVNDSLRMSDASLARHGVTVVREFEAVPPMTVDKHRVLQILVNLVRNAKHACDDAQESDRQVTLRIQRCARGVRLIVADNGVGIPPQNLSLIFNHGFTTREGGHGFGLHASALAAAELGGSLSAESAGAGQGATFTLDLPLAPVEEIS